MTDKITKETLTPDFIVGLFRKHNITPFPGILFPDMTRERRSCCGMGVVLVELKRATPLANSGTLCDLFGSAFVGSFEWGFDHAMGGREAAHAHKHPGYTQGHRVGSAAKLLADQMNSQK